MASVGPELIEHVPEKRNPSFKGSLVAANGLHSKGEDVESRKQDGVEQLEAITKVWSKKALYITFVLSVIFPTPFFSFLFLCEAPS